jgi:hypothetical protein
MVNLLKLVYNSLLFTVPSFVSNPLNKNPIVAPIIIPPHSTYINYKLEDYHKNYIQDYINNFSEDLEIIPIKLSKEHNKNYYISINIYNCSSPLFMSEFPIIRCEINTYVKNKNGQIGTLILDYLSNGISMDPINIFRNSDKSKNIIFKKGDDNNNIIFCKNDNEKILLDIKYKYSKYKFFMGHKLVEFTDWAFYKNGIADKVYYDSSLVEAITFKGVLTEKSLFIYKDLVFHRPESVFFFKDQLNFLGSMWHNL